MEGPARHGSEHGESGGTPLSLEVLQLYHECSAEINGTMLLHDADPVQSSSYIAVYNPFFLYQ